MIAIMARRARGDITITGYRGIALKRGEAVSVRKRSGRNVLTVHSRKNDSVLGYCDAVTLEGVRFIASAKGRRSVIRAFKRDGKRKPIYGHVIGAHMNAGEGAEAIVFRRRYKHLRMAQELITSAQEAFKAVFNGGAVYRIRTEDSGSITARIG